MTAHVDLRVSTLFNFSNHIALITGGASGLGEMAAQALVQNDARVIIASRKESELKRCTDMLNTIGPGKCEYIVTDLKDKAGCDQLAAEVKKRTDTLTVLLNNSGATCGASYDDFPEDGWDEVMALNVKAIFYLTVGVEPLLRNGASASMSSRVINIAFMAGVMTLDVISDDGGSDGSSKAACIHLSKIQAFKLAPLNIMVNCICPGGFPSRMTEFGIENFLPILLENQPTGRIGKPEDFAGLVLFPCSYGAAHITGNVIEIDGGSVRSGWVSKAMQNKPKN